EAHGSYPQFGERPGKGMHNLVLHATAEQWMWMTDDGLHGAPGLRVRASQQRFQRTGGALYGDWTGLAGE
ncbi:MAG: hypothetical protein ACYDB8_07965, partial [Acidiferrobacterales bacterium]